MNINKIFWIKDILCKSRNEVIQFQICLICIAKCINVNFILTNPRPVTEVLGQKPQLWESQKTRTDH